MTPLSFILLVSIMTTYCQATFDKCYRYGSSDKLVCFFSEGRDQVFSNLTSAQTYCQTGNGYLLEIANELVYNLTRHFIKDFQSSFQNLSVILNLKRSLIPLWTWINGEPVEQEVRNVTKDDDPNKPLQYGAVVKKTSGYRLVAEESTVQFPYVCSFNVSECQPGGGGLRSGSKCLQVFSKMKDRWGARNDCLKRKGDLGTLKDLESFSYVDILTFIASLSLDEYWIGLQKEVWTWQKTGKPLVFSNWAANSPLPHYRGGHDVAYLDLELFYANSEPLGEFTAICLKGTPDNGYFNEPFPDAVDLSDTYDIIKTVSDSWSTGVIIGVSVVLSVLVIIIIITSVVVFLLVKKKTIRWPRRQQNTFGKMEDTVTE